MSALVAVAGQELAPLILSIDREMLVRYAGASGDFNPIHYSDHAARSLGLDGCLAHGLLTMGLALRVVTDWCGDPARVRSYRVRFAKPVPVPDDGIGAQLRCTARVTQVEDDVATVAVEAACAGQNVLAAAVAEVTLD